MITLFNPHPRREHPREHVGFVRIAQLASDRVQRNLLAGGLSRGRCKIGWQGGMDRLTIFAVVLIVVSQMLRQLGARFQVVGTTHH